MGVKSGDHKGRERGKSRGKTLAISVENVENNHRMPQPLSDREWDDRRKLLREQARQLGVK